MKADYNYAQLLFNSNTGNLLITFGNTTVIMTPTNPLYDNLMGILTNNDYFNTDKSVDFDPTGQHED